MRAMTSACFVALAAFLLACGSMRTAEKPSVPRVDPASSIAPASEDLANPDSVFVARHLTLLAELSPLESVPTPDLRAMEARSILAGAETMYLLGRTEIALELLGEAETALKTERK